MLSLTGSPIQCLSEDKSRQELTRHKHGLSDKGNSQCQDRECHILGGLVGNSQQSGMNAAVCVP